LDPFDPRKDYPLGSRRPELVRTPSGVAVSRLTLEALRSGRLAAGDMRATPETLRRQADVARASGRLQLADNLSRAAELTAVPDEVVLAVYTALRPRRSTAEELEAWAVRLERDYGAAAVATLVRDASATYRARGLLSAGERPPAP
jgi:propanediol dehydratase small subunit